MSFRPLLPVLLAVALAACSTTVVSPSEGTGANSSTPTDSGSGTASSSGSGGSGTGSGSGTPVSSQIHSDHGACGLTDAATPLANTTIYNGGLNYTQSLYNVITFSTDQVWSGVITDQTKYQPFQDSGLPAVDFSANAVLVTAATNGCGGNVAPSAISTTGIDGAAHLEVTYSLLSGVPSDSSGYCLCENISSYSLLAVEVPKTSAMPTICVHEVTGC